MIENLLNAYPNSHLVTCHLLTLPTQCGQIPSDEFKPSLKCLPDEEDVLDERKMKMCEKEIQCVLLNGILDQTKPKPTTDNGYFWEQLMFETQSSPNLPRMPSLLSSFLLSLIFEGLTQTVTPQSFLKTTDPSISFAAAPHFYWIPPSHFPLTIAPLTMRIALSVHMSASGSC